MTEARAKWQVQVQADDGTWHALFTEAKLFCVGYAFAHHDGPSPRLACRVVHAQTGKVAESFPACTEVGIGMVAGWPTPEQYESTAERALAHAAAIRASRARRPA